MPRKSGSARPIIRSSKFDCKYSKKAPFTRSVLYKYFSTKEEIFIELIKSDISRCTDNLETAFQAYNEISVEECAGIRADTFASHPRLSGLIPVLLKTL